ncbi:MAG: Rrf2 family transcriptional regulator [Phycisphaerales bacterium]|nr:Rrf2 family transcriptional regulator [Phycisphaerales bacterium]
MAMLSLTKKTEYALIALCHLAKTEGTVVSARDIAERFRVRLPLMMNILKVLSQKGLVRSVRGAGGGYQLADDPAAISLSKLVEAMEGPMRLVRCATPLSADDSCELLGTCPVRRPVLRVHDHLQRFLGGLSVADVAFDETYGALETPDAAVGGLKVLAT